jgi:hypothetical protein
VNPELLHHPIDGSGQQPKPGLLLGLDHEVGEIDLGGTTSPRADTASALAQDFLPVAE